MKKQSKPRRKTKHLRRMKFYTKMGVFVLILLTLVLIGMQLFGVMPF